MTTKQINAFAARYILNNVILLSNDNYNGFISEKPSVPKIVLFSDKTTVPTIFKALSVSFEKKMEFGMANPEDNEIVSKYKIKKFPTILVIRSNDPKPKEYKGEMKYRQIFDFLNVYSETFVAGGDNSITAKPWLLEAVPEMHRLSVDDICLKKEGALCAILFLDSPPSDSVKGVMKDL